MFTGQVHQAPREGPGSAAVQPDHHGQLFAHQADQRSRTHRVLRTSMPSQQLAPRP